MLRLCNESSAARIANTIVVGSDDRKRPATDARERFSFEQLHRNEALRIVVPDLEHLTGIRMADTGGGTRLAAKTIVRDVPASSGTF